LSRRNDKKDTKGSPPPLVIKKNPYLKYYFSN